MSALNNQREQWGSRLGFILAAMGSAVGLGNIWRFSYVTGEMGGGAFLIIYLACILLIGLPILMAEFTIGKRAQKDVVGAFQDLAPGKPYVLAGFLGVASAFIILSFYGVIGGWSIHYFVQYLGGGPAVDAAGGYADYFGGFISQPLAPLFWQFLFMALTIGIVYSGVKKGIEKWNKILMPGLAVLVILLAGYSLTLGGAAEAMNFMFSPDWSAFGNPQVYLAAMGQAFFSLSLGMGALITYGSYLSQKEKLPGAAASVVTLDTVFALIAGIMIFPAVFAFGIDPADGPGLVFITLPGIFESLNFGIIFGLLFFFLLVAAAISSSVSLLEVATAYFMRRFAWSRQKAALIVGGLIFLIGVPSSLGNGILSGVTIAGNDILDSMDFLASNIFLPLGGMIIALFIGWGWKKADALDASDFGDTIWGNFWLYVLRYFAPIAIFIVFLNSIGLF
ncbi:sodium-dependent transporter [Salisediminibacterium halotolerans]|uniref:sodium-dependent transporter n=1 Tax=Salisediminibacterium halotolerans TaxID=517425 RepID=UPI000EB0A6AE|nr:sodium-dependent transporter [Salisediminibacterium halotolerans]RLJ80897.1 NSS family neurotransmitter:Na+ symporter [Actinophytocola xinjiangensis]RPE83917.1 NSS family neurotransmitter:Na+ symporter [Salisediminibacterium halotolerans]TWG37841.1 NSS family neurotransmitter:Na+ symporter [Salisediminibacterium halotolerans]GEL08454.1 transporter [Salisediminibacterium halotolerans]